MKISLKSTLLFVFVCVAIIILILLICKQPNKEGSEIISENRLNSLNTERDRIERLRLEQKMEQAEERNDIEMLQEKMPWLDIISARWVRIALSDSDEWVPGPTLMMTIGLLTLDSDYLNEIMEQYQWSDDPTRYIPNTFLTDYMEGYVLKSSGEYGLSYRHLFRGGHLSIAIDFEKEIVLFSFVM